MEEVRERGRKHEVRGAEHFFSCFGLLFASWLKIRGRVITD